MNLSYTWLTDYLKINMEPQQLGEVLTDIGLEVEGIESVKNGPDLEGVVVGEVLTCEKHPNADRLKVTTVNVGNQEILHIVCGAPNVAQGQKVLVATVGTNLPTEDDKPFKIKKGKIRGEVSEGMICAEDELGIGTSHEGILVLDDNATIGQSAEEYLGIDTDIIFEIGLTPNRSDATSVLGVAEDLNAYFKYNKISNNSLNRPNISKFVEGKGKGIDVVVEDTEACPRYSGILLENLQVGPSPDWIRKRLKAIGVRSKNNIVDITNFVLHEYGQPLHAFDADKIAGNKIIVKKLEDQSEFETLDEVTRKLSSDDLMICDTEGGLCIAGVFGGLGSGITDNTTRMFLESAHFDASNIRRTSFRHLLRTDAAMVYEKGSDPNITVDALQRAVLLLQEYAGATVASELKDVYPNPIHPKEIIVSSERISKLTGIDISRDEIATILHYQKMEVSQVDDQQLVVKVPTNKADVTREVDVLEEILRIYGYNNVPLPGYIHAAIPQTDGVDFFSIKNQLADVLTGAGFSESMGLSIVENQYFTEDQSVIKINNTSNIGLNVMRPHMVYSILGTVAYNLNRQQSNIRFFENGSIYTGQLPNVKETNQLTLTMVGDKFSESWSHDISRSVDFFDLKSMVQLVMGRFGLDRFQVAELDEMYFDYGLKYHRGPIEIVTFGKVSNEIAKKYAVKKDVFTAVFNWESILQFIKKNSVSTEEISKFPSVRRDLALVVDKSVTYDEIVALTAKTGKKLIKSTNLFDVYESDEHLGEGKKSYAISYQFENKEKTLQDKDVNKVMDSLISVYAKKLGAQIRK